MVEFVGLYVIRHRDTAEIQYQQRQMFRETLPENQPQDIIDCVATCNGFKIEEYKDFDYIDMYGIVVDGETQWWEESE